MKERKAADEAKRSAKAKAEAEDAELERHYYRSGPQKLALPPAVGDAAGALNLHTCVEYNFYWRVLKASSLPQKPHHLSDEEPTIMKLTALFHVQSSVSQLSGDAQ